MCETCADYSNIVLFIKGKQTLEGHQAEFFTLFVLSIAEVIHEIKQTDDS